MPKYGSYRSVHSHLLIVNLKFIYVLYSALNQAMRDGYLIPLSPYLYKYTHTFF